MARICTALRSFRARQGLTQLEAARRAGISRQALNVVEAGRAVPSTAVALHLARALGCTVEDLFWLDDPGGDIVAELAEPRSGEERTGRNPGRVRVALAEVSGRWVAHALESRDLGALQVAADGLVRRHPRRTGAGEAVHVEPLRPLPALRRNRVAVGCDPGLGLLAARVNERFSEMRLVCLTASSEPALEALRRGHAHLAGAHLLDEETGEFNVPFVRRLVPRRALTLVTLASWEEGLAVAPGNPLRIRRIADLARRGIRIVNRDRGAGARRLLDRLLRETRLREAELAGYRWIARSHPEVAQAIAAGVADAGIVPRIVADAHGLDFVPLALERFDLVIPYEWLQDAWVARALETLKSRSFRRELSSLGGYDTTRSGQIVAELGATA